MSRRYAAFKPPNPPPEYIDPANDMMFDFVEFDKLYLAPPASAEDIKKDIGTTDVASKLVNWAEDATAQTDYHFIGVDTTLQPVTITLPNTGDISSGKILLIKDEGGNASNNAITVTTNDGSTIDGNAGVSLVADYASISVYFNGTGWHIY
jgi:hypothetical protein|tara:strand:- start:573 stop:1025 length:453 start_codon:yes stop_codon:yes gene_type:complete